MSTSSPSAHRRSTRRWRRSAGGRATGRRRHRPRGRRPAGQVRRCPTTSSRSTASRSSRGISRRRRRAPAGCARHATPRSRRPRGPRAVHRARRRSGDRRLARDAPRRDDRRQHHERVAGDGHRRRRCICFERRSVELRSQGGRATVAVADLVDRARARPSREPDELLVAVGLPAPAAGTGALLRPARVPAADGDRRRRRRPPS